MRAPPKYLEAAGVLGLSNDFPWKGEGAHYGPSQGTPLHDALGKIDACAITTVAALVTEWLIWRFRTAIDAERYLDYVDAVLAWEIDLRYRDTSAMGPIPKDTAVDQVFRDAIWMLDKISKDSIWEYPEVNVHSTASLISIAKQTLPAKPKKAFSAWLDTILPIAAKLAPYPDKERPNYLDFPDREEFKAALRPYFGKALPREALDPDFHYGPEQREELLSKFLQGLDWHKNPFLRSPEKMKELGFAGTPYQL